MKFKGKENGPIWQQNGMKCLNLIMELRGVELTEFKCGEKSNSLIAGTNGHAKWIKWKNENFE